MPEGFCETDDVRKALQKSELSGSIGTPIVEAAIDAATSWFARATNGYWYDSGGGTTLVPTTTASATNVRLDVPSSPHRTDRQLMTDHQGIKYPVTHSGPFAKIPLPHLYVDSITALKVRDLSGGRTDWVAASDKAEGDDEDYYVEREGQDSYGRTILYIRADSIGGRIDWGNLLTLDYDYGLDVEDESWEDVKRGIANLAAAEVLDGDGVIAQIPDNARLVGVDTEHQNLINMANRLLDPYTSAYSTGT